MTTSFHICFPVKRPDNNGFSFFYIPLNILIIITLLSLSASSIMRDIKPIHIHHWELKLLFLVFDDIQGGDFHRKTINERKQDHLPGLQGGSRADKIRSPGSDDRCFRLQNREIRIRNTRTHAI